MITLKDFSEHFAKAKKAATLEHMVCALVRDMRLRFDPSLNSARITAMTYKELGNMRAHNMLMAAYLREKELEAAPQSTGPVKATLSRPTLKPTPTKVLEDEMAAWFSGEQRTRQRA